MRIHSTSSINTLSLLSSSFTLCQHFLSLPMLPFPHPSNLISLPISFLLPPSILPSIIPHSLSLSLLPLFSPLLSVSVNSWKKRREMTRESRLTDSCCQNTSIKHTHTSVHALVIADMYTHTLTHTQSSHGETRDQQILCTTRSRNTSLPIFLLWCQMTAFSRHVFKFLNGELLWHYAVVNFSLTPAIILY